MSIFVVLTRGRTGSTPLVEDIGQHSAIVCHQELFRKEPITTIYDRTPSYEAVATKLGYRPVDEYLAMVREAAGGVELVGFKVLLGQLEERASLGLRDYIFRSRMPVIMITRDPARAALSAAIANARNAFNLHVRDVDPDYRERAKLKVRVDPGYVVQEARYNVYWTSKTRAELANAGCPNIEITYEDYTADRLGLVNRIFRFLGVSDLSRLETNPYSKLTSSDVWNDVTNAGEVILALKNANLRDM